VKAVHALDSVAVVISMELVWYGKIYCALKIAE
jgi:hypothetical protein